MSSPVAELLEPVTAHLELLLVTGLLGTFW